MKDMSYDAVLNKSLNKAADLQATHIVLDKNSGPRFWGINQSVRVKAYRK
jgi:hypothetical protein